MIQLWQRLVQLRQRHSDYRRTVALQRFGADQNRAAGRLCEGCHHFSRCELDDPNDDTGKCDLQFDPLNDYGAPWISRKNTCHMWTAPQEQP